MERKMDFRESKITNPPNNYLYPGTQQVQLQEIREIKLQKLAFLTQINRRKQTKREAQLTSRRTKAITMFDVITVRMQACLLPRATAILAPNAASQSPEIASCLLVPA